jgi:hypothetical protein
LDVPLPFPYSSGGSEKASLISSGDHPRPETKRITALSFAKGQAV